jgi:NTE family protein
VSAARSMGADFVIAVDVNLGCDDKSKSSGKTPTKSGSPAPDLITRKSARKKHKIIKFINDGIALGKLPGVVHDRHWMGHEPLPNILEVLVYSFNIMEALITETRLKSEPPDLLIQPELSHIKFLEFKKADEAITEGYNEAMKQLDSNPL